MSACTAANHRILVNITNMENHDATGKVSGDVQVHDVKGVQAEAEPTPAASSLPASGQPTLSIGENINKNDYVNKKTCPRLLVKNCGKFESGSGSGDQEGGQHEDGVDIAAKKRKTRRGKPKNRKLKPYSKQQLSCQQQLRYRSRGRLAKTGRQPPAPYNTTQFLMEDHSDLPDLDQKLSEAASSEVPATFQKPIAPPRTRDSSFSIDSDEDYFYSSPEDEEEFLTKEFSSAYEDVHAERLNTLSKSELIQEYLQLEAKVDLLTKRLRGKSFHQSEQRELESNSSSTDSESAKKLKIYQQRIEDLTQQNEQLKQENETLRAKRHVSPVSSVDSESDSDSTSNENRSRCNSLLPNCGSSSELMEYVSRSKNSQRKDSSESSSDSKSDTCDSSSSENSKTSMTPVNLSNGHVTIQKIDGLAT
ncbi:protein HEXIM1 [Ceratina calcarata]|uniref:Protein HEXIM1 n=1 Tax=Ceratina calcarata TaxID=156304 RepID=A0AAJ7JFD7_9HYME|nr:protein HEXIM1 [Ceratina calcarata]